MPQETLLPLFFALKWYILNSERNIEELLATLVCSVPSVLWQTATLVFLLLSSCQLRPDIPCHVVLTDPGARVWLKSRGHSWFHSTLPSQQRPEQQGTVWQEVLEARVILLDFEPYSCFLPWTIPCRNLDSHSGLASNVSVGCGKSHQRQGWQTSGLVRFLLHHLLTVVGLLHSQKESGTVKGNTCFDVANSTWNS